MQVQNHLQHITQICFFSQTITTATLLTNTQYQTVFTYQLTEAFACKRAKTGLLQCFHLQVLDLKLDSYARKTSFLRTFMIFRKKFKVVLVK